MSILQEVSKTPAGSQNTLPVADMTAWYREKSGNWYCTLRHQQTSAGNDTHTRLHSFTPVELALITNLENISVSDCCGVLNRASLEYMRHIHHYRVDIVTAVNYSRQYSTCEKN